jgi:hypothetical protein
MTASVTRPEETRQASVTRDAWPVNEWVESALILFGVPEAEPLTLQIEQETDWKGKSSWWTANASDVLKNKAAMKMMMFRLKQALLCQQTLAELGRLSLLHFGCQGQCKTAKASLPSGKPFFPRFEHRTRRALEKGPEILVSPNQHGNPHLSIVG